ncbi:MAG: hypothetical protein AB8G11_26105 [Saprospiraceae bacterium]
MTKLASFKKQANIIELTKKSTQEIKGGLRYYTESNVEFVHKVTELSGEGKCVCWGYHDGVYCIEW